jgi:hypothetical protein
MSFVRIAVLVVIDFGRSEIGVVGLSWPDMNIVVQ